MADVISKETFVAEGVTAILFDDSPRTLEEHLGIFDGMSLKYIVAGSLSELRVLLLTHDEVVLFLDQHMPDIYDFGEVGMPAVKTDKGENVGIAVIRGLLPAIGREDVPAYLLSGFPMSEGAKQGIQRARDRGMKVDYIRKDNLKQFETDLRSSVISLEDQRARREFLAAEAVILEWTSEDPALLPRAFGYKVADEATDWGARRDSVLNDMTLDVGGRVSMILFIKEGLTKLFGDSAIPSEIGWLKEEDPHLFGGRSPWSCIFSGNQHELAAVAGLLARIVG